MKLTPSKLDDIERALNNRKTYTVQATQILVFKNKYILNILF